LVQILAELRADDGKPLASRVGGVEPILSTLRFQRLLRARDEEFVTALRRAIVMADRCANVARIASDILLWDHPEWGDRVRARWCFEFFDVSAQGTEPQSSAEVSS
jgi:CRISPR system Cascade subunit CasB